MTLPYPDSPELPEYIGTSITRIKDNLTYLDGKITDAKTKHILSTNVNMATRDGLVNVGNIGFLPKGVTIWAIDRTGNSSSFGNSDGTNDACTYEDYNGTVGATDAYCLYLIQSSGNELKCNVDSFANNQAVFDWYKEGSPVGTVMDIIYIFF